MSSAASPELASQILAQGITVDLRNPEFSNNILRTEQGGVVTGPNVRIQARKIIYTRTIENELPVLMVEAEGDLILEFGEYMFVGDRLEYDFQEKTGILYNGRTGVGPWYFGGERIRLNSDGSYTIYDGFVTTSENYHIDWQISSTEATLVDHRYLSAKNVQFRFVSLPLLWIPSFKINLDSLSLSLSHVRSMLILSS